MSNLIGTDKQIAWAEQIRTRRINEQAIQLDRSLHQIMYGMKLSSTRPNKWNQDSEAANQVIALAKEAHAKAVEALNKYWDVTSAKAWIENRSLPLSLSDDWTGHYIKFGK